MAGKRSSVISVLITGDNKELRSSLDDSSSRIADFGKKAGLAVAAVGVAFTAFAAKSVSAAIEAEAAQQRLAVLLRNTGLATEDQIVALNAQAAALEKVGVASASNITVLQAQLATFDLSAEAIATLTPAITDYVIAEKGAAASAGDFQSAANGLAQALQGNFGALSRVGFVLDDTTKELIANGTEAERAAALVDVLSSTYDGFNEKARDTVAGGLQALRNQFGSLQESLGNVLLPHLKTLIGWFQNNEATISAFADKTLTALGSAIRFIGDRFEEWKPKIKAVVDFFKERTAEFRTFFNENLRDPINNLRTAINTFVDQAKIKFGEFGAAVPGAVKAFTEFIKEVRALSDDPKAMGDRLGQALSDSLLKAFAEIKKLSSELNGAIRDLLSQVDWFGLGRSAVTFLIQFGLGFAQAFLRFEWFEPVLKTIRENLGTLILTAIGIALLPAKIGLKLGAILSKIPLAGKFLAFIVKALQFVGDKIKFAFGLFFNAFGQAFNVSLARIGPGLISRFVTFLQGLPAAVGRAFDTMVLNGALGFGRFGTMVGNAVAQLVTRFRELMAFLLRPFTAFGKTLVDDLFNLGKNAIGALIRGLRSMGTALFNVVRSIGRSVWDTLSKVWKISSPSKVFMGIGEDAMKGLALGLSGSERMLRDLTAGIGNGVLPSIEMGGGRAGQAPIVINVSGALDAEGVARQIEKILRDSQRRTGGVLV
jgi:hypothetical protein